MSRAELGNLTPSVSVTATTQNATVNNPLLEPIRAKTADLALEWYFAEGSLLSAAFFYKDIETYIQRITADRAVPQSRRAGFGARRLALLADRHLPRRPPAEHRGRSAEGHRAQRAGAVHETSRGSGATPASSPTTRSVESEIEYILASVPDRRAGSPSSRLDHQRPRRPVAQYRERHVVLRRRHLQRPHDGLVSRQVHPRHPGLGGQRRPREQGEPVRRCRRRRGTSTTTCR